VTDFVVLVILDLYSLLQTPVLIGMSLVVSPSSVDAHGQFIFTIPNLAKTLGSYNVPRQFRAMAIIKP